MSFPRARQVLDGLVNTFRNIQLSALAATGTPSSATFLRGDGTWSAGAGGGGSATPAASTLAEWDANVNMSADAFLSAETSTAASATPIVMTIASTQVQTITGTAAQIIQLPTTSITAGYTCIINSQNTGGVTVKAADGTTVATLPVGAVGVFRAWIDGANDKTHWVGDVRLTDTAFAVFNNELAITHGGTQTAWFLPATPVPAASTLAEWDVQANLSADAFLPGQTSTAASATPITMTLDSKQVQVITGTTTAQTILLPTTLIQPGFEYVIVNQMTTANVTVEASDGSTVAVLAPNEIGVFRTVLATPTTNGHWVADVRPASVSFKVKAGEIDIRTAGTLVTYTLPSTSSALAQQSTVTEYFTTTTGIAVPAGATALIIDELIGPGCGGGSGRRGAAGIVRCGGGGGGSGGKIENLRIPVSLLSTTITVTLPAAGNGGAAVTADNTNGNPGTAGAAASISSGANTWSTFAGTAGAGGTATAGAGGAMGQGPLNGSAGGSASATGGVGTVGGNSVNGAPSGGGAGGGITAVDVASNGSNGGVQTLQYSLAAAAGGIVGGASPGAGNAALSGIGGNGGGGGAASITGAAQSGGTSPGYGAGGAGGGASLNGNNSGAGTAGGPAYGRIRWAFD